MADSEQEEKRSSHPPHRNKEDHPAEEQPAAEWGERIATGKSIARGGKSEGTTEGAQEQKQS